MRYPVEIEKDECGYVIRFPDVPEAVTWADDMSALQRVGLDALESALEFYAEEGRPVPLPASSDGDAFVELPLKMALWIHLHNAQLESGMSKTELAEKAGMKLPNLIRLLKLKAPGSPESMARALRALGKRVDVCIH